MKFLQELLHIAAESELTEGKKKDGKRAPTLAMLPIKSFVAGNMMMSHREDEDEDPVVEKKEDDKVIAKAPKPRNQQLHRALSGRKGGAMYDAKRDYVRAKEKAASRKYSDE